MKVAETGSQHGWICFLRQVELHVHHRELALDFSAAEGSGSSESELAVILISEKGLHLTHGERGTFGSALEKCPGAFAKDVWTTYKLQCDLTVAHVWEVCDI